MLLDAVGIVSGIEDHLVHDGDELSVPLLHLIHVSRQVGIHKTQRRVVEVKVYAHAPFVALQWRH